MKLNMDIRDLSGRQWAFVVLGVVGFASLLAWLVLNENKYGAILGILALVIFYWSRYHLAGKER